MRIGPAVVTATFELFHVWSAKPDWALEVATTDRRLRLTGTTTAPTLPGPSDLHVAYIDEPKGYAYQPIIASLRVMRIDVSRVHIDGTVRVDDLAIDFDLDAALVT